MILASACWGGGAWAMDQPTLVLRASNASKAAIETIAPMCARNANVKLRVDYANNPAIATDIENGAHFDVVIIETGLLQSLANGGFVAKPDIVALAALDMGLATREPGPSPRIDTVSAFKRTLLGAKSLGYIGDGHSGVLFLQIIDRLKLRQKLGDRLVPFTGAYEGAARESERLQYVVAPFFTPLPAPLRLVGSFPPSLGADVRLSAAKSQTAIPGTAAFVACLDSPAARSVFRDRGYRLLRRGEHTRR